MLTFKRILNEEPRASNLYNYFADKMILPGMIKFTKLGYTRGLKRWSDLPTNLENKNIVITGATSGLGKETALSLNKMGANLLIVARDSDKAETMLQELKAVSGNGHHKVIADLMSIEQTLRAATEIKAHFDTIDVLVNNAGALFNDRKITEEQLEQSFSLLLMSPFTLTQELMPNLLAAEQARVINVSSGGMYTQPILLNDLNYENGQYDGPKAYARAKRGLVDITEYWAQHYSDKSITFNAMHPGWADTPAVAEALPGFYKLTKPYLRTPAEGADTIIWLAASDEAAQYNGDFWLDRQPHTTSIFPGTRSSPEKQQKLFEQLDQLKQSFSA